MINHPSQPAQRVRLVALIGQLGLGGSEKQLFLVLKHIDPERFESHVVVFNSSAYYTLDQDLERLGVQVHSIPPDCQGIPRRMAWLYRLFRRLRPQIIHSWSLHDNPYAGLVGRLARAPVTLGSVRGSLASPDFTGLAPVFRRLALHSVHGLVVNSQAIQRQLVEHGVTVERIYFLPNCVEVGYSSAAFETVEPVWAPLPAGGRLIGLVGNLRPEKNHALFIQAVACLLPNYPDLYGVMIGQPISSEEHLPDQIRGLIRSLDVEQRLILAGFHPDPPALLPRFYALCLSSDSEGMPNAVLEAMAAGLPVVATRVGGISHLVQDGVNGLLVEPGDVEGLSAALRRLLDDPALARAMGQAGRQRILAEFSEQVIIPPLERYYNSLLNGRSIQNNHG